MSRDEESLDELATALESVIRRLHDHLAAENGLIPLGADLVAMRRIWVAGQRLATIVAGVGEAPNFSVERLLALVGARLAEEMPADFAALQTEVARSAP